MFPKNSKFLKEGICKSRLNDTKFRQNSSRDWRPAGRPLLHCLGGDF